MTEQWENLFRHLIGKYISTECRLMFYKDPKSQVLPVESSFDSRSDDSSNDEMSGDEDFNTDCDSFIDPPFEG